MMEAMDQDKLDLREAERLKIDAFVKVQGAESEFVFRTRDLSANGLFLYTKVHHIYPFKVGSTLKLELYDYDTFVTCEAVVVRIVEPSSGESEQYPAGFGVRISSIDDEQKQRLEQVMKRIQESGSLY